MPDDLDTQLRAQLREAMVARDRELVSALRTVLAALANAEAVPVNEQPLTADQHFAGSKPGIGAAEAPRRELSPAEQRRLIAEEIADLRAAARTRAATGANVEADGLLRAAAALERLITTP